MEERKTDDGEAIAVNWPHEIETIKQQYRDREREYDEGIPNGVQKDAIQNSFDAILDKKNTDGKWKIVFELIEDKKKVKFITITDSGTTGLTGAIISNKKLYEMVKNGEQLHKDEKWTGFTNLAFSSKSKGTTLGNRGRGKFIFVGASKKKTIIYESKTLEYPYRMGWLVAEEGKKYIKEGDEGKKKLRELMNDVITPIDHIGTRIIIPDPLQEVIDSIKDGNFLQLIEETWWEIIKKFHVKIVVKQGDMEKEAKVPEEFNLPNEDKDGFKVWKKDFDELVYTREDGTRKKFKVKTLHFVLKEDGIFPERFRGIALHRNGMKITTVEFRNRVSIPYEKLQSIYGYITLADKDAERELANPHIEGTEHCSIRWTPSLPRSIKEYVEEEIAKFAKEKLGWGKDEKRIKRQKQRNAEEIAINKINTVLKRIGYKIPGKIIDTDITRASHERHQKEIHIKMPGIKYPNDGTIRVNYEQSVSDIKVAATNNSEKEVNLRIKIFIETSGTVKKILSEKDFAVKPKSSSKFLGPFEEKFDEKNYPIKGKYNIRVILTSLDEENLGFRYDSRSCVFYLEDTPPAGGIFERCRGIPFPDEKNYVMGEIEKGEGGGYMLTYNMNHKEYQNFEDEEETLALYLFRIMAFEICRIDMVSDEPKIFKAEEKTENPDDAMCKVFDKVGELINDFFEV